MSKSVQGGCGRRRIRATAETGKNGRNEGDDCKKGGECGIIGVRKAGNKGGREGEEGGGRREEEGWRKSEGRKKFERVSKEKNESETKR